MASGMPSSRRQMSRTASAFASVSSNDAQRRLRALDEQLDRFGAAERRNEPRRLAGDAERLAAGREDAECAGSAGAAAPRAPRSRRRGARSCRARGASGVSPIVRDERLGRVGRRGRGCGASVATSRAMIAGSRDGGEIDPARCARTCPLRMRATSRASRVFPLPPAPVSVRSRVRADEPRELGELMAATDEPRQVDGEIGRGGLVRERRRRRGRGRRHSGGLRREIETERSGAATLDAGPPVLKRLRSGDSERATVIPSVSRAESLESTPVPTRQPLYRDAAEAIPRLRSSRSGSE